jgi:hypothetical protein
MSLLDLSSELILSIASDVRQVDLLNISLVCKRLRAVTEPELYREYSNLRSRPFAPFVKRLISDERFTRYVKKIDLRYWHTLDSFKPENYEVHPRFQAEHDKAGEFDENRPKEPSKEEYEMYTAAAKAAGLIAEVVPYSKTSQIVEAARPMRPHDLDPEKRWYDLLFGDETSFSSISYDKRFCHILRAGIDDPLVVLIVAMLPNVSEIRLDGAPADVTALSWQTPNHRFTKLRRLTAAAIDDTLTWPVGFFNSVLAEAKLEIFEANTCSSWFYQDIDETMDPLHMMEVPITLQPGSLQLGKLELVRACLRPTDMECLVKACPHLKKFTFSSGNPDTDPYTISPALLIDILGSVQESLEELCLEIDCAGLAEQFDPDVEDDFIHSLVDFKSLKMLSTPAEMWSGHETDLDAWYAEETLENRERICRRLPSSIEILHFPLSEEESELPLIQLQDLCRTHAQTLPRLRRISMGPTNDPTWLECFEKILSEEKESLHAGERGLEIEIGEPIKTNFDAFPYSSRLPDLKWFGTKYAIRKPKPRDSLLAGRDFHRIKERYSNLGLEDDEVARLMSQDPEMQVILRQIRECVHEETLYESADEEGPYGTPHPNDLEDS